MNFLETQVVGRREDGIEVRPSDGACLRLPRNAAGTEEGARLTLGVGPEHPVIGDGSGDGGRPTVRVAINLTEPLGGESFVCGALPSGDPGTIKQPGQVFIEAGAVIPVAIDPVLCHLLDGEGRALPATARERPPLFALGRA